MVERIFGVRIKNIINEKENDLKRKILVIDDEQGVIDSLKVYLGKEGYIVDEASNGHDGLERLKYMDYSCVLLDVHLPMLNGKTILAELRKTKATP